MLASRFTAAAAGALCLSLAALPTPASAQASREGPTFVAAGAWPGYALRRPDVAYDPVNNVYLVISGPRAHGRFVSADGVPLGTNEFDISTSPAYNQTPRVAYGNGMFLVTWLDVRNDPRGNNAWVYGRLLSTGTNGAPTFVGPDFLIGAAQPSVDPERAAAVAFSTVSNNFLVVFHQYGPAAGPINDVRGQLVSTGGALVGAPINISFDNHFQGEMGVGYSADSDQFLVAFRNFTEPSGPATIRTRTVNAATGAMGDAQDITFSSNTNVPEVAYNSKDKRFFVAWWQAPGFYYARFLKPDGSIDGNVMPLVAGGGYDSLGTAYNTLSDTYFNVYHASNVPQGFPQEDVGHEISGAGLPSQGFDVTVTGNKLGNFNPRIAASSTRREWLAVTATGFALASGQRIKTDAAGGGPAPPPPPPPPDIDLSTANAPNGSWFLAEGNASPGAIGFHTYYLLANENDTPVDVRAYFAADDGRRVMKEFTIAANSRITVDMANAAGNGSFASVFQSKTAGKDIYVSRSIFWGPNFEGSTGVSATKDLARDWYFAEGSRGGELFDNFFLVFNPLLTPTTVHVTFLTSNGGTVQKDYDVPAQKRLTLYANLIPELAGKDFSTTISGAAPIVAERAMYWKLIGGTDTSWIGGTASMGAIAPRNSWVFAEGAAAPFFETFYLLLNPNMTDITVRARFLLENGTEKIQDVAVPAHTRSTIYMNGVLGNIGGAAATFSSTSAFLAERSIYWGAGRVEGTNVIGAESTAMVWHFPEGSAGGAFDTFLLLANPGTTDSTVVVTLYVENVGRFTMATLPKTVRAGSRLTLYMNDFLTEVEQAEGLPAGTLKGKSFSSKLTVTAGSPIVAEEAIYWLRDTTPTNYWHAGAASFGIPQ